MVGGVHLVPSMEGYERCEGRYPHTKHARWRHRWKTQKTQAAKPNGWQFSVRISGVFLMGICNFGNLIGPPNPPFHHGMSDCLGVKNLQVSTQENVRGAEVERFLVLQMLYIFFVSRKLLLLLV